MLYTILGFSDGEFPAGLGWHHKMNEGFPLKALWTLSKRFGMSPDELSVMVSHPGPVKWENRAERLTPEASDHLFRLASAYQRLFAVLKDDADVLEWLRTSHKEFKGLTPVELLSTTGGSRLVQDAIGKLKPPKQAVVEESHFSDDEDDLQEDDSPIEDGPAD